MKVGSDQVNVEGNRLIIHAAEPMDWPIREFCRIPICFESRKYYVRSKHKGERPYAMVYELWPWPANLHEASTRQVVYDAAYVVERDEIATRQRGHERCYVVSSPSIRCWGSVGPGSRIESWSAWALSPAPSQRRRSP